MYIYTYMIAKIIVNWFHLFYFRCWIRAIITGERLVCYHHAVCKIMKTPPRLKKLLLCNSPEHKLFNWWGPTPVQFNALAHAKNTSAVSLGGQWVKISPKYSQIIPCLIEEATNHWKNDDLVHGEVHYIDVIMSAMASQITSISTTCLTVC